MEEDISCIDLQFLGPIIEIIECHLHEIAERSRNGDAPGAIVRYQEPEHNDHRDV